MTTDTGRATHAPTPQEDASTQAAPDRERLAVVVGHDAHPASVAALRTAIDLAQRLGAHLHVIHSVTVADCGIDPDIDSFELERDRNVAQERQTITDTLALTSVRWTYHQTRGDPATHLARLADEVNATFIVVGATEPGVMRHLLHGDSVSKRLLHTQDRPVLIVPPARPAT